MVGVDGSVPSKAALAWAVRQARLTGAAVEAVIAWELPAMAGYPVPIPRISTRRTWPQQVLAAAIAGSPARAEPVEIEIQVTEGNAARAPLDASGGADLLVVGSRGHGGFVEALLGLDRQHCVHHATCPVVVIRDSVTGPWAAGHRPVAGHLNGRAAGLIGISQGTTVEVADSPARRSRPSCRPHGRTSSPGMPGFGQAHRAWPTWLSPSARTAQRPARSP